jgi:serine/threonine protein kinase/WD40 repeat protein
MNGNAPTMKPDAKREAALFQAAANLTGRDRATFLDGACHGDHALRQRLGALLTAHEQSEGVLADAGPAARPRPEVSAGQAEPTLKIEFAEAADEAVGQKIGRYKILEKIGEGGCGVVYVAEQTEPVRRRVALKVIKLGMDTKQVVARFEAERQALAMMDHPNIAKVLDAGTTDAPVAQASPPASWPGVSPGVRSGGETPPKPAGEDARATLSAGRPYFVMELVRGIKITDYCDQNHLSTKERLNLFIQICHAIQHAHQKGIIHRDIKPSNILVTLHDGVAVPKVIDFGIAKATEGRLTDATVYTQFSQFIGTPAYMSPEQAEMSGLDIDTRSDIYSLGVLLYELLTGKTPFDANELASQGLDAMPKTIREREPARPSTKLATLQGEELTTTAKRRSTDRAKLMHQLKGDLDWIAMKCLEKDRTRRYETANGLAADLKRHLENEPVVARPPSAAYRLQKAFRRNKLAFTAATAVTAALVLGIIVSTSQSVRAIRAKRDALAAQANETRQRQVAEQQARRAGEAEREATEQATTASVLANYVNAKYMLSPGRIGPAYASIREAMRVRPHWEYGNLLSELVEADANGKLLAVLSVNGDATLFDVAAMKVLAKHHFDVVAPRIGLPGVPTLSFSPSGKQLLFTSSLWSKPTTTWNWAEDQALERDVGSSISARFVDENTVVSARRCDVAIENLEFAVTDLRQLGGPLIRVRLPSKGGESPVAWRASGPDGKQRILAASTSADSIDLFALSEETMLSSTRFTTLLPASPTEPRFLAFSPDSGLLALAGDNEITVFQTTGYKSSSVAGKKRSEMNYWSLAAASDFMLTADTQGQLNNDKLKSLRLLRRSFRDGSLTEIPCQWPAASGGLNSDVWGIATTPDMKTVAVLWQEDSDSSIGGEFYLKALLIYQLESPPDNEGRLIPTRTIWLDKYKGLNGRYNRILCLSPDGQTVAFFPATGDVSLHRVDNGALVAEIQTGLTICASLDGSLFAGGSYRDNQPVRVWRTVTGAPVSATPVSGRVVTMAITPDNQKLYVGWTTGIIECFNVASGIRLPRYAQKSRRWRSLPAETASSVFSRTATKQTM